MAKIQIETSKDGKTYLDEIEDTDIDATKQKLEGKGYTFKIKTPLSKPEAAAVLSADVQSISPMQSAIGGLTQGLSLGTADFFGEDTEALRIRQEAEHPYIYGGTKFLGSLVPSIGLTGAGALAGGLVGGPPGAVIGGATMAGLSGLLESYASKPTPPEGKKLEASDAAMAVASGLTEGVAAKAAPMVRGAYRSARNKLIGSDVLKGATEIAEDTASGIMKQINAAKGTAEKIAINNKYAADLQDIAQEMAQKGISADEKERLKRVFEATQNVMAKSEVGGADPLQIAIELDLLQKQLREIQATAGKYGTAKLGQPVTTSVLGGAAAAVPMAAPDSNLSKSEIEALQKRAIAQAYYNMQRSKLGSAKQ